MVVPPGPVDVAVVPAARQAGGLAWPTWQQAAIAAAVLLAVALATRKRGGRATRFTSAFAGETALVSALYAVWQAAHALPLVQDAGAERRGRQVFELEQWLHLPSELALERWIAPHRLLSEATNVFYATVHVPALLLFLLWLFVRHRDQYGRWRNALAILTGFCLLIRFVRVAPPRLLPDLGFFDLGARYGQSVYGPIGTGLSDQYAAMPSIHVGWAAVVGLGIVAASRSRWRWLFLLHPALTMFAVSATGNHWWLDGIVAIALLGVALLIDAAVRRLVERWRGDDRDRSGEPGVAPAAPVPPPEVERPKQPASTAV